MQRKEMGNFAVMMRMIVLIKGLLFPMACAIVMGILGFLCAIFIPFVSVFTILTILGFVDGFSVNLLFLSLILMAILRGVLHYGEQACNHFIAFKLLATIRDHVFAALRRLAPAKLEVKDKGNLISLITSDIELLEVFYAHTISPIMIAIFTCIILLVIFYSLHPLFALIALIAYLIIGILLPIYTSKCGKKEGEQYRREFGDLSSYTLESLRGMEEIMQYGYGDVRLQKMHEASLKLNNIQKKLKKYEGESMALSNAAVLTFSFAMMFISMWMTQQNDTSFTSALLASVLMLSSFGPVLALSALSNNLLHTLASGRRVLALLDEEAQVKDITDEQSAAFGDISIADVSFAYEEEMVLKDINETIKKGQITGIHGKSGSGKSTLLKLIMRFWDITQGNISIHDRSIKNINTIDLRHMESLVAQESDMFHDSIEANIKIAKLDATHDEVVEACKKASIHDFIMSLPQGYDTMVEELGDSLSGGEIQRIALARAFLHDSECILLDEPTSNLDALNEAVILKSLKQTKDKTIILVSHRESTMGICNHRIHIDSGRVS